MIQSATFDHNSIKKLGGNHLVLGLVDGLSVLVEYSHDYSLSGESWTGGPCIEFIKCPVSDAPINLDREDELLMEALNEADQYHMACEAGYGHTLPEPKAEPVPTELHHHYN